MKKLIISAPLAGMLVMSQYATAQSVDDIVTKYIDALGGKEKLMSLKTLKMEGNMNVQGADLTITSTKSHMAGFRLDIEVMGTSNYQIVNSTKGTAFWPIRGMSTPEDMSADQFKSYFNQLDIQGPLVNYKEKGIQVEFSGTEKTGGSDTYKLKITYKNGVVANYFIDMKTNRLVKTTSKVSVNGQEMEVETSYSDYRQNADGYWFAYTMTTTQGTVNYDKITTNMPVEESLFKF